jgi:hypothetical protein
MIQMFRTACLLLLPAFVVAGPNSNWTGPYRPCINHAEVLRRDHMNIGVRFDATDPITVTAVRRALVFWSTVLDVKFHDSVSSECALAIVEASGDILTENNEVARAQFVDWDRFEGWIAFDPHISEYMSAQEVYATAVHELGHVFGLHHNMHASSVMFFADVDVDTSAVLDDVDLRSLRTYHAVRASLHAPIAIGSDSILGE